MFPFDFLVDHFYFDSFVPYEASISGGDYRSGSEALAFVLTGGVASRTSQFPNPDTNRCDRLYKGLETDIDFTNSLTIKTPFRLKGTAYV